MDRRTFVKTAGAGVSLAAFGPMAECFAFDTMGGQKKKPNILFIFTDQQNAYDMSCAGNPYVQTPHIDSLASIGTRFEYSYCSSPVCTPSRGSIVSGVTPHKHQAEWNNMMPEWDNIPNMGTHFREHGYETVWGGKWHLPASYPLDGHKKFDCSVPGFDPLPFLPADLKTSGKGALSDEWLAGAAVDYLSTVSQEKPFLLAVSFHNPHDICYFPKHIDNFPLPSNLNAAPPLPDNFEINDTDIEFLADCRERENYGAQLSVAQDMSDDEWRRYMYNYYRMTEAVDTQIGRVLDALEKNGLDENTLIIFTSDHGDGNAAHKWAAKLSLYEESARVPLIVAMPGTTKMAYDAKSLTSGMDIFPTMCEYASIPVPNAVQGESLKPVLEKNSHFKRDFVVTELAVDNKKPDRKGRMIRTEHFKYILFSYGQNNEQFFDLKNDPGEKKNRINDAGLQTVIDQHRQKLAQWMTETQDDFVVIKAGV